MAQQLFGNWRTETNIIDVFVLSVNTDVSFSKQTFLSTIVGDYQ